MEKALNMNANRYQQLVNIMVEKYIAQVTIVPYVSMHGKQFGKGEMHLAFINTTRLAKGFSWYDETTDNLRGFRQSKAFNDFIKKYAFFSIPCGLNYTEFIKLYNLRKAQGMKANKGQFFERFAIHILAYNNYVLWIPTCDSWWKSADIVLKGYGFVSIKFYECTYIHGATVDRLENGLLDTVTSMDFSNMGKPIRIAQAQTKLENDLSLIRTK